MSSGYTHCTCRDCFDVTVSNDETEPELCSLCEEAGCDADGEDDCQRDDAYDDLLDDEDPAERATGPEPLPEDE